MANILARQRQIGGTTAEWTTDDLVLGDGEIAIEKMADGTIRAKVGDGTKRFSACPYLAGTGTGGGGVTLPADAAGVLRNDGAGGLTWLGFTATPGNPADAGKLLLLDGTGSVAASGLPTTTVGGTPAQAGKIPVLGANGSLPLNALPASITGALHFAGAHTPTGPVEYPAGAGVSEGNVYVMAVDYTFTGGALNGTKGKAGDLLIKTGGTPLPDWEYIHTGIDAAGGIAQGVADTRYLNVPRFDPAATYAAGAYVQQNNILYRANGAVAPGAFNPAGWSAAAFMDNIPAIPAPLFPDYDTAATYTAGTVVRQNGTLYRARTATTAGVFNAAQWAVMAFADNAQDVVKNFDPAANYALGDVIVRGGVLMRANRVLAAGAFNAAAWDVVGVASTAHANTWSAAQTFAGVNTYTGRVIVPPKAVGDGNINLATGMDFLVTPTAGMTFAFTNLTAGQRGMIHLENTAAHAVTLGAGIQAPADLATDLSTGDHVLSYWCITGTTVVLTYSAELV